MASYDTADRKEVAAPSGTVEKKISEAKKSLKSQNFFRAIDLYTDLLVEAPIEVEYLISRSAAYDGIGSHKHAIIDAKIALQLSASNLQALSALAKAYYGHGDYEKAQETLLTALNIDSKNQKLLDLYQMTTKRLCGDSTDNLQSADWLRRDASGKIISQDHSHDHDHDNDHDHDHDYDHGHGHSHSHSHSHSHDNEPQRRRSLGSLPLSSHSHDHHDHDSPAVKRRGSGSALIPEHDHGHSHDNDHDHDHHHEVSTNDQIEKAISEFYSSSSRDHRSLRGSFSQQEKK